MKKLSVFVLASLIAGCQANSPHVRASDEHRSSDIGYESVSEAFEALSNKPGVQIRKSHGWVVIDDPSERTLWSFTPKGHYAHPSVAKRSVVQKDGSIYLETKLKCGSKKHNCDKLAIEFANLDKKVRQEVQTQLNQ